MLTKVNTQSPRRNSFYFAVYRNPVLSEALLYSENHFGHLVNELSNYGRWINPPQDFYHTPIAPFRNKTSLPFFDKATKMGLRETFYKDCCLDFMDIEQPSFLFIVHDYIFINPESIELLTSIASQLQDQFDIITIDEPASVSTDTIALKFLKNYDEIHLDSVRGIIFSADGAKKYLLYQGLKHENLVSKDVNLYMQSHELKLPTNIELLPVDPFLYHEIQNYEQVVPSGPELIPNMFTTFCESCKPILPLSVKAFLLHWYKTWDSVYLVYEACIRFGFDTTVLNSTTQNVDDSKWINSLSISFFSNVEFACRNFENTFEYMLLLTADVTSPLWERFFNNQINILGNEFIGTLSPQLTSNFFQIGRFSKYVELKESNLVVVPHNDIVVLFINKKIVKVMSEFFTFFRDHANTFEPKVGYGLGEIVNNIAYQLGLINIRDRSHVIRHPDTKSYSEDIAFSEMSRILSIANDFMISKFGVGITPDSQQLFDARFKLRSNSH